MRHRAILSYQSYCENSENKISHCVFTSFGVLCCGALTGVLGLAAETGLVKTGSRPDM